MPQMEAGCVTGTDTDLTAQYFVGHKIAVKGTTPVMKERAKNCASKAGMETCAFRVSDSLTYTKYIFQTVYKTNNTAKQFSTTLFKR